MAILGGGPSAMAAAFELTATEELRERFHVTVHQPGHRLGGKGASGRDRADHDRILEHGLHIWFGFYDNAFGVMRRCYEELDRPAGAPLATLEEAFEPNHGVVIYERWKDRWVARSIHFPRNPLQPGDPELGTMLAGVIGWLTRHHAAGPLTHLALRAARGILAGAERLGDAVLHDVGRALSTLRDEAWEHHVRDRLDDDDVRFWFQNLDIAAAVTTGIGADRLLEHGLESADDEELSAWLRRHGCSGTTLRHSPVIRGLYDSSFAYEDGDKTRPNIAAGTAVRDTLRTLFGHRGAFFYKMQAGMGDTVFSPFYEVLRRRGVEFRFFSAVTALRPDASGALAEVVVVDQVGLPEGEYLPLYDVEDLPCWPSEPDWSQLQDGERLALDPPDFEHVADPLGRGSHVLRRGQDFDDVVLAFPPDVQRTTCAALRPCSPRYADMLDATRTVMTQAFQVWFDRPLHGGLGWPYPEDSICGSYVEPLDTWSTMTQVLDKERNAPGSVRSLVYCCGVMADEGVRDLADADRKAHQHMDDFLRRDARTLWPDYDPAAQVGTYARANLQATERYVLSTAGSVAHRLWPHESGIDGLVLCGDWTRNGLDAGCIEASVTSGMLAARALSGLPDEIAGVGGWLHSDPSRSAGSRSAPVT